MKAFTADVSTIASGTFVPIMIALVPSTLMAYGYAIWFDYEHGDWGHLVADLFFPPMGMVHGYALLFSGWLY